METACWTQTPAWHPTAPQFLSLVAHVSFLVTIQRSVTVVDSKTFRAPLPSAGDWFSVCWQLSGWWVRWLSNPARFMSCMNFEGSRVKVMHGLDICSIGTLYLESAFTLHGAQSEQVCAVATALWGSMCGYSLHPRLNYRNFGGVEPFQIAPRTIFTARFIVPNFYVQFGCHI